MYVPSFRITSIIVAAVAVGAGLFCHPTATGQDKAAIPPKPVPYTGACSIPANDFFADEVWARVGAQTCLKCHKSGGDAEDSKFVLIDPQRSQGDARIEAMRHNREVFASAAKLPSAAAPPR